MGLTLNETLQRIKLNHPFPKQSLQYRDIKAVFIPWGVPRPIHQAGVAFQDISKLRLGSMDSDT